MGSRTLVFFPGSSSAGVRRVPLQGPRFGVSLTWVLTSPLPWFGPCRARLPLAGSALGCSAPGSPLPACRGSPLFFVRFAPFFLFLFCVLVRFTAGRSRVELGRLCVTIFGSSSIRFGLGASIESDCLHWCLQQNCKRVRDPTAAQNSA